MKAIVRDRYGSPDVLELREIPQPALADEGVLVRVHAASVNPFDWHMLTGTPYLVRTQAGLRKPKSELTGVDFAGTVEAVGKKVTRFQPGDEVYGGRAGAFAEFVCARQTVAPKPPSLTFEQAAAVPMAGITALQALRDKGRIRAGQKVLINGASGGVGTFGVQIAKAFGADVTGVCSTRNVELVRSIGADHVIDYTREDFTRSGQRYDLILDVACNHSWSDCKRALTEDGISVVAGGPKTNRWIGPMGVVIRRRLASLPGKRKLVAPFLAKLNTDDLLALNGLLEAGKVTPVVEKRYPLAETAAALAYVGDGHAQGKVVITM
jgi:NADPH:quinone reductase-like Zn-dependent oxidoreductase